MQTELEFTDLAALDGLSVSPVEWLLRSYDSFVEWKSRARAEYVALNGDSHAARNRVAWIVRNYFTETQLTQEEVGRWKDSEIVTIRMLPPNITDSNATYVDWSYIADVLLLHCAAQHEDIDKENQRRETEYLRASNSYKLRLAAEEAQEAIRRSPQASDDAILESLTKLHPDASVATIKEARRREKAKTILPKVMQPQRSQSIAPFVPLYFQS